MKSEVSLHQRIRANIEQRILSGEWGPGYRIPFEHELMVEYDCARMTVNKALFALTQAGLIERRRRVGSFVRRPAAQSAVIAIPDIEAEIVARGQQYRYELLAKRRRRATKQDRELMRLDARATVLAVTCLHYADARPAALEDRRIVLDEVPAAEQVDFSVVPPGGWLLRHIPWHVAENQITALNAPDDIATLLQIETGSACLVVDRKTWRMEAPITSVRLWFPGDLQRLFARFTPAGAAPRAPGFDQAG
ncbi:histidine utilization repressor [Paraburkholderia sp. ZP32-5]|uniref:histidine utilization repressor n=1 Tax=Paraburkholderia sp. ZP32-5 TaxID=2883245 RepID=UPI001F25780E|nr:histidine utilization repressor [Paraburkholderia sp. ZP32-5]